MVAKLPKQLPPERVKSDLPWLCVNIERVITIYDASDMILGIHSYES